MDTQIGHIYSKEEAQALIAKVNKSLIRIPAKVKARFALMNRADRRKYYRKNKAEFASISWEEAKNIIK